MKNISGILLLLVVLFGVVVPAQDETPTNPVVIEAIQKYQADDFDGALSLLQAEVVSSPNDPDVHNALAIVYMKMQENQKAEEHFNKAISLRDRNYKAYNNKFSLLMSLNRYEDALALLSDLTSKYPDYSIGWLNLASLQMQFRSYDDALNSVNAALANDANDAMAIFKRGQIYLLQRQYDKADADFSRVLELEPTFEQARQGKNIAGDTKQKLANGYIRVRQIMVRTRALADQINGQLKAGADFVELAVQYSQDPSAKYGGALGLIKRGGLIAVLEDAMFSLNVGELSGVIESPAGFHIFLREE